MDRAHLPPLIFVAHNRVRSIFFLGTPHQGAAIAQVLARYTAMIGTRPFVEDLFPQSDVIRALGEDFPEESKDLQLFSFYESRPMTVGLRKMLIVDKASAVMNLPNERQTFLDANHRNVAMYATRADPSYVAVRNALARVIASCRMQAESAVPSQEDRRALARFLGVPADPEDDLRNHASAKLPGSCEWLGKKSCYQTWVASREPAFLWLQGRPGVGKSVLSSHVVGDLRNNGLDPCFFFFQARDSAKSAVDSCLRSLAWQMAVLHPAVFHKLKAVMSELDDGLDGEKVGSHSLWQKVFVSGILTVELERPQFWVIDAMDECRSAADMTAFLAGIQEHWPLSVLVTSRDAAENYRPSVSYRVSISSYTISEQDSLADISLLLAENLACLPCPASDRWPTAEALASHILARSAGCFLWASLICSELRKVTSEGAITRVLNSTPADMDAVYADILTKIEMNGLESESTRAVLTWAVYAFRPLGLAEMQTAAELDADDKIGDIRRLISKNCGNLMYVDEHDRIQFVHLTAREFLTRGGLESCLIPSKADAHRRLASACLKHLASVTQKAKGRARKAQGNPSAAPFTTYASKFLFQHLDHVDPNDDGLFLMLLNFLGSNSLLSWVELAAANGDLRTVYEAGRTIKDMLNGRTRDAAPPRPNRSALTQEKIELLGRWGDDLARLIPQFAERLGRSPKTIRHHIAPFCPPNSVIRQVFGGPTRGLTVGGLSTRSWDDCLATIRYPQDRSPFVVAAAPGYVAVGIACWDGRVVVHDDAIFQELHTIRHGERVSCVAFATSGRYLASAGSKTVRIWSPANGLELACFGLPEGAWCRGLSFAEGDTVLRAATVRNELIEWDLESRAPVHDEPVSWGADVPERMRGRAPEHVWLSPGSSLLAVVYHGHDLVFWDCAELRLHDVYEQKTGSMLRFGDRLQARGWTTVRAAVFNHDIETDLFAATFDDGDMVVFDLDAGRPIAVNKEGAYNLVLACSHDGRTLAAVDQLGNMTLFEFRTLRILYRVRLETSTLPHGLAFTGDNRRVVELREGQCRVWEPPVLRPGNDHDPRTPITELKPMTPREMYREEQARKAQEITAITCSREFPVVFYATGNGSVFGYDISGPEPEKQLLFVQDTSAPTRGCVGGRPSFDRRTEAGARPRNIEAGPRVFETPETAHLTQLRVIRLSPELGLSLSGFGPLSHPHYFATYAKESSDSVAVDDETIAILIWDFQDLEDPASQHAGPRWEIRTSMLPAQVVHLIGVYGTRLVFHAADHWVASFELLPPGSSSGAIVDEESFVRHFFLPNHWIGSLRTEDMRFGIGSEGDIIFDRLGELAVIKRGLELTEDGEAFQPRQLSAKGRAKFSERIPYRPPGIQMQRWL
ncbi:hypothetical protein MYCTH_2115815 [Thermothelomyces thermophilus ATCC 42464]|uniref:NACHT domain-containing protein n=1 Tax=Thermothelomyces thermophilus (strain ATCC 42464 / BCRC 31852 / DSM 1799) TaxID=573729 RepID=G2Q221_THET4|nr:uncharacterized protein MYCTH_2115815 [Thermothelomyces thermophilus ATCC 42464]AEO55054.1 hypothetical protein MYCTH_2115815 [Thermothelomyces thermophilus ATCC 42464]